MADYVLGLDLGPNSIGWALVSVERDGDRWKPVGLLETSEFGYPPMGVRVFEEGLQNFDTGKEASKNQARRQARAARRTLSRRRARRRDAMAVLQDAGLLPRDQVELRAVWNLDPYRMRAEALSRPLEPHELGRALYHLAQRRGFKSNRLSGDEQEEKGIKAEMSKLEELISKAGKRTLGEYLHSQRDVDTGEIPVRLRVRQARMDLYEDAPRRTRRSMYEQEFDRILDEQERLAGRPPLTDEHRRRLYRALFFQHPFAITEGRRRKAPKRANLHRAPGVRACPYEKGQTGCPRSDWLAQRFRILKEVRNLRVSEERARERPLTPEESEFVVGELQAKKKLTFASLKKEMIKRFDLLSPVEFNLERGGRKDLKGNEIEAELSRAFGRKAWESFAEGERERFRELLVVAESPEELRAALVEAGLEDEKKREKLLRFRPKDDGYLAFSRRALERIVPLMEEGLDEYEAIARAYPETFVGEGLPELPSLVAMQLDKSIRKKIPPQVQNDLVYLTNPVVRRALVELRKVVNALVRDQGKPVEIVVELAREMKQAREDRKEYTRRVKAREDRREFARRALRELYGGPWPPRAAVDRWMLWDEQGQSCPYCGKGIGLAEVVSPDTEVDHIMPRWRSLDDSMNNKVLCCQGCNAEKGNRTPIEWLGEDSDRMRATLDRVWGCVKRREHPNPMPWGKAARFEQTEIDTDQFVERQLNDTRYISRVAARYLLLLYPTNEHAGEKRVRVSRGGLTAYLRRQWGLNTVIPPLLQADGTPIPDTEDHEGWTEKKRIDHRHHAVDALVVALSSRALLKRLQDSWKRSRGADERMFAPVPWEALREDAGQAVRRINVSHRPCRRRRGALHEATYYGRSSGRDGAYVTRKRLEALSGKSISDVRDAGVRRVLEARLKERGWDGKANKLPERWYDPEPYLPTRPPREGEKPRRPHPIRRVRVSVQRATAIQLGDRGHRYAWSGDNFCLQVARHEAGDHSLVFRVVTRFEAHRERGRLVPGDGLSLLGALHRKDSVLVSVEGREEPVLAVVQTMSGPVTFGLRDLDVRFRDARDSRKASAGNLSPLFRVKSRGKWTGLRVRLADVDPLGRVVPGPHLVGEGNP